LSRSIGRASYVSDFLPSETAPGPSLRLSLRILDAQQAEQDDVVVAPAHERMPPQHALLGEAEAPIEVHRTLVEHGDAQMQPVEIEILERVARHQSECLAPEALAVARPVADQDAEFRDPREPIDIGQVDEADQRAVRLVLHREQDTAARLILEDRLDPV